MPDLRVPAHDDHFVFRERPGLEEDVVRNPDLADVVEFREKREIRAPSPGEAERRREPVDMELEAVRVPFSDEIPGFEHRHDRVNEGAARALASQQLLAGQRVVGFLEEIRRVEVLFVGRGKPQRQAQVAFLARRVEFPDADLNVAADPLQLRPATVGQQDRELVASDPRGHRADRRDVLNHPGDVFQKGVSRLVAECVVDELEPVEVADDEPERDVLLRSHALYRRFEVGPVEESRQRVVRAEIREAFLEPLPFGHVTDQDREVGLVVEQRDIGGDVERKRFGIRPDMGKGILPGGRRGIQ